MDSRRNWLWKAFRTLLAPEVSHSLGLHTLEAKLTPAELARKYTLPLVCSPGKIKNDLTFHHLIWRRKHLFQEASGSFFLSKSQGLREIMQLNQNSYTTLLTYKYYRKKNPLEAEKYNVFLLKATSFFQPMRKGVPGSRKPWGQEYGRARPPPGRSPPPPSTAAVSPVTGRTSSGTHPGPQVPIQHQRHLLCCCPWEAITTERGQHIAGGWDAN